MSKVKLILSLVLISFCLAHAQKKPNIVIIMADDLGWNDVSFHGSSEIPTPNIDALAYNGVILNRFYSAPLCTPTRSAIMTGKYPTKLGMQHLVILNDEPWGLPLNQKLMPEYFKDAGYRTSLVGKWHLGFHQKAFTPTLRGFDSHFGYLGASIDYFDYTAIMYDRNYSRGYDMRRNLSVNYINDPKPYVTELFTNEAVKLIEAHDENQPMFLMVNHLAPHAGNEEPDNPLEAPESEIEKFAYIKDPRRRILAAMISVLDQGVGKIVTAINKKGIMDNTVILFLSDNGGPTHGIHSTEASNFPLRGQKQGVWEGGCRVAALIYSPLIKSPKRVSNELMHVTDLLPTFAGLANIKIDDESLDGFDQWGTISTGAASPRNEVLYNIESVLEYSALMNDGWKLVNGSENLNYAGWFGRSGVEDVIVTFEHYSKTVIESETAKSFPTIDLESMKKMRNEARVKCTVKVNATKCNPTLAPCLFNIFDDPCEQNNLAVIHPEKVKFLLGILNHHLNEMVPMRRKITDPNCDPKNYNNTWTWWRDEIADSKIEYENFIVLVCVVLGVCLCAVIVIFACKVKPLSRDIKYSRAASQ